MKTRWETWDIIRLFVELFSSSNYHYKPTYNLIPPSDTYSSNILSNLPPFHPYNTTIQTYLSSQLATKVQKEII